MSEVDTEQATEQVASPAEGAGVSPELAAVAGEYSHILDDMAKDNGAEVPQEASQDESTEVTEPIEEGEATEEAVDENKPFSLKVKGQTIDVSEAEMLALAQKGMRFTQKSQELSQSNKMGLQLQQANKGDKAAQKAILEQWQANGDLDDLVDSLEGVEAKLDTSELENEALYQIGLDNAFEGIDRNSAEFGNNLGVIESEAKGFLPDELYSKIVDSPADLRVLHDMVADGSFLKAKNMMSVQLATKSPAEQAAILSNPKQFGEVFDALWDGVTSTGSASQQSNQAPAETQVQTPATQTASPSDEPPSALSSTKREAQVTTGGDVDFF